MSQRFRPETALSGRPQQATATFLRRVDTPVGSVETQRPPPQRLEYFIYAESLVRRLYMHPACIVVLRVARDGIRRMKAGRCVSAGCGSRWQTPARDHFCMKPRGRPLKFQALNTNS
ncbi:unnamed protein product [Chrysodeixis includens]|uniref:Uncharacterized protein n=1 Tax=Chrysodeixis includens TaxID=689277 RepID=A0A9N8PY64_CHRIL|nr:unnamed protein product [Chrysodeixis includens]